MVDELRQPVQDRAKATRERLLQAAGEVFGEVGLEAATTHAIAQRAGVSVGTLYNYFPAKEALLTELFDRHAEELWSIVEAPFAAVLSNPTSELPQFDARLAIEMAITAIVESHRHNPPLHRAFCALERHPALAEQWRSWEAKGIKRVGELLQLAVALGDLRPIDPEVAAFLVYHATQAVCHRAILDGAGPAQEKAVAGLVDMICSYLLAPRA